ncbi:THO complex subunit 4D-like isoform X1 [Iris pallida]|uniref:THO complex subunit 4D-like isoform X1 n=1 Tax=Iris pallida TaxID=29817 RepID=A0AAX6GWH4_IRIPA|nr:THO complex subunit 4D-like isoform X1 [Iris pallida]
MCLGFPSSMVLPNVLFFRSKCFLTYFHQSFSKAKDMIWRHDLFEDSMVAAGLTGVETGTKLYISNLDYGVSNEDIKELFSEIGYLKRCAVHYDRNGRPSGSAEVMFRRRSDAMAALKRYNNVQLDGKAMKIELVGSNLGLPVTPRVNVVGGANGRGRRTVVMTPEFGRRGTRSFNHIAGSGRGGFQRGRGRGRGQTRGRGGRGRGKRQPVEKSAGDLDKDLETYHAEAMNTS